MQSQTASSESKYTNKYSGVMFIQINQHSKKLLKKIQKGPNFMKHGVYAYMFPFYRSSSTNIRAII